MADDEPDGPDRAADSETPADPTDPRRIRSIAVHREDVATALEATLRSDRRVVLRVTPPYSGRMRARIHRVDTTRTGPAGDDESAAAGGPIHVDPADLVEDCPAYPEVDETAADLPEADVDTRRERHAAAVAAWRDAVRESVGGTVTVSVDAGDETERTDATHEIDVVALG